MKISTISLHPYQIPLTTGQIRLGTLIHVLDHEGNEGWGDVAPLPNWSKETLEESLEQFSNKKGQILKIDWSISTCFQVIAELKLLPSLSFGLESALLAILSPLPSYTVPISAHFMGSVKEILEQEKGAIGFSTAKLKVGNLSFDEADFLIHSLKDKFHLRIDVNRAWETEDSLHFFSQFNKDTFDYVEEPFKNPKDLPKFPLPLAIDESYPQDLSLDELEKISHLKAVIYKPTMQGGITGCLALREWAGKKGIDFILSSSFESDIGLCCVASVANRLSLLSPIGIGTNHYLLKTLSAIPLKFSKGSLTTSSCLYPNLKLI